MPKLSAVLNDAAFQAADDSLKTFYVQNTETKDWWLDVDEPGKLDVAGQTTFGNLKTKLDGAFKERDTAKASLKAYEALGKTADELKAALEANRPEEVTKLVEKYEAEKQQLKASYEEPLTAAQERAKKLEAQVERSLTQAAIQKLRNEYDLNDTADYVLRDFIKAVTTDDGDHAIKVFDNGVEALVAGQPQTPEGLIKSFQEAKRFPAMFNVSDGAGTGNTNRAGAVNGSKQYEGLSPVDKLTAARENGVKTG